MPRKPEPYMADNDQGLAVFYQIAARSLLAGNDFASFRGLVAALTPDLLDTLGVERHNQPPELVQAFATHIALEINNATPLPDNRFRPRRLPKPERNAPCPCGSGRKYKQCCGAGPTPPDLGISEEVMLAEVLDLLPQKHLAELPLLELHPESLALVAGRWIDNGQAKKAIKLLEGLFAHMEKLDGRAEMAADELLNAYLDVNAPRKKQAFIDALKNAPDKALRSTGWQRQATIFSDQGKLPQAWEAFREAQRLTPNEPALSHLEILMLVAERRRDEAKARAQFWTARLSRDRQHDYSALIDSLNLLAESTDESLLQTLPMADGPLAELAGIVAGWPPPACHYTLKHGELTPKKALKELEDDWREILWEEDDLDSALAILEEEPLACHSFIIIDDAINLCRQLPGGLPDSDKALARSLLERAEHLRTAVLEKLKALGKELNWGWLNNRPMLMLAQSYAIAFAESRPQETLDLLRWCVNIANPNDNQGLREILVHRLVDTGLAEEACALFERYPDDFLAGMIYGGVLAYFAAGRKEEAAGLLGGAIEKRPKVWKMLQSDNPRKPVSKNPGFVTVGGDEEAWIYWEEYRALWKKTGALDWGSAPGMKSIGKKKPSKTPDNGQGSLL